MKLYATARALEMAMKQAAKDSPIDTGRAIEGFFFHRLLCRVFYEGERGFVLKGGQGVLARTTDARATRDIDLLVRDADIEEGVSELKRRASIDLDDYVSFQYAGCAPIKQSDEYRMGYTLKFDAYLGSKKMKTVPIDLVTDEIACEEPEMIDPADRFEMPGIVTVPYPVYTAENAMADKLCGIIERYGSRPSSRVKDLVDMVIYSLIVSFDNQRLSAVVRRELTVRKLSVPHEFVLPKEWGELHTKRYRVLAQQTGIPDELRKMSSGYEVARSLFSLPLNDPYRQARWDTQMRRWQSPEQ